MLSEQAENFGQAKNAAALSQLRGWHAGRQEARGYKRRVTAVMRSWKSCRRVCTSQHSCQGIEGKNFDMISWFSQSPAFAAAWSPYRRQPRIENFDVYQRIP
jgi:hypothetical protein